MLTLVNSRQSADRVIANGLDHEAFKSMILTTLDKGNPPELFTYWAGARTAELVRQNKLEPLDELWQKEQLDSRFSPAIIEAAATYAGHKYLLPITQHLVVFFYNKHLFNREQLSPPPPGRSSLNSAGNSRNVERPPSLWVPRSAGRPNSGSTISCSGVQAIVIATSLWKGRPLTPIRRWNGPTPSGVPC